MMCLALRTTTGINAIRFLLVEFRQQVTSESERTTRQERIDPKLHASGWIVTPYHPAKPLSGYSNHAITALEAIVGDLREIVALIEQEEGVQA